MKIQAERWDWLHVISIGLFGYLTLLGFSSLFGLGYLPSILAVSVSWFATTVPMTWLVPHLSSLAFTLLPSSALLSIIIIVTALSFWMTMFSISMLLNGDLTYDDLRLPWKPSRFSEIHATAGLSFAGAFAEREGLRNSLVFYVFLATNPFGLARFFLKSLVLWVSPRSLVKIPESENSEDEKQNLNAAQKEKFRVKLKDKYTDKANWQQKLWRAVVNSLEMVIDIPLKGMMILFYPVTYIVLVAMYFVKTIYEALFPGHWVRNEKETNTYGFVTLVSENTEVVIKRDQVFALKQAVELSISVEKGKQNRRAEPSKKKSLSRKLSRQQSVNYSLSQLDSSIQLSQETGLETGPEAEQVILTEKSISKIEKHHHTKSPDFVYLRCEEELELEDQPEQKQNQVTWYLFVKDKKHELSNRLELENPSSENKSSYRVYQRVEGRGS